MSCVHDAPAPSRMTAPRRWLGLGAVLSAVFMAILDGFVTNVAAPVIRTDLGASAAGIQGVVAIYNLVFGLLLIPGGRLGDLIGRRRVFMAGLAGFTASSLAASLAPDTGFLILARAGQGVFAALAMPQVFSIIQVMFNTEERGAAFGAFALVSGVAASIAQLAAGVLIAADPLGLGWRTIFLVNVPIGIAALVLTALLVPESRVKGTRDRSLDGIGVLLLGAALLALTLPLTLGVDANWPPWALPSLAVAPLLGWAFLRWQRRRTRQGRMPLIELTLLSDRRFAVGNLIALLFYAGNAALFLALPLYLQGGNGYSPLQSGLVFSLLATGFAVSSTGVGRIIGRYGHRLILLGATLLLGSYALLAAGAVLGDVAGQVWTLMPGALLAGIAMGFVQAPVNVLSLGNVREAEIGSASGILTTSFELGYGLGTVLLGLVFFPIAEGVTGHGGAEPPAAAAGGFDTAFLAGLTLISVLTTLVLAMAPRLGPFHTAPYAAPG